MNKIYKEMPKIELHAHLNGSLSKSTIQELARMKQEREGVTSVNDRILQDVMKSTANDVPADFTLDKCFVLFGLIHRVTDHPEAVRKATADVIKDFWQDGVYYLEIRTTPKQVPNQMSYQEYLDAVISSIKENTLPIMVKLLISIDRSKGLEVSSEIQALAISNFRKHPDIIVGMDVSGNMIGSHITDFFPLLEEVRQAGLKLSIHIAEIHDDKETEAVLRFHPDRIGHGTFIPPIRCQNPLLLQLLKERLIPLELCLTSNVKCNTVTAYEGHHLGLLLKEKLPFVLCTDDKGVFDTCLSQEYVNAARAFGLSVQHLWDISLNSINYCFATEDEKHRLQNIFHEWVKINKINVEFNSNLENS